jgi:hypothetical protein
MLVISRLHFSKISVNRWLRKKFPRVKLPSSIIFLFSIEVLTIQYAIVVTDCLPVYHPCHLLEESNDLSFFLSVFLSLSIISSLVFLFSLFLTLSFHLNFLIFLLASSSISIPYSCFCVSHSLLFLYSCLSIYNFYSIYLSFPLFSFVSL